MTSFDLADTHHAKSTVCQIKYKLLQEKTGLHHADNVGQVQI